MAKRYIGIELDGETVRVALLTEEGGTLALDLRKQGYETPEEALEAISELTGGARLLGDYLVTALPAGAGFSRSLNFPFKDRNKLLAVLPSELDSQVPISLANYTCAMQSPQEKDGSYQVEAAAVRNDAIESLLEHFPDQRQHPRRIDLFPHALVGGVDAADGLLVYCARQETEVALVLGGRITEFRLFPVTEGASEEKNRQLVLTLLQQFEQLAGGRDLPLWVCGAAVTDELLDSLQASGRTPTDPELGLDQEVSAEFLPAVLLALSEKRSTRQSGFNFRSGPYAPEGQLDMLKKKLVAAAVLLLLCLMVLGGSSYFDYHRKAGQAELLDQQLEAVYRQTIPDAKAVFDVPLQLQSYLKELREQALVLGVGGQVTALNALQTLSSLIDDDLSNDLQEMTYNGDQIKLDGYTGSFDAVNRITQALGKSELFSKVEISDAKMAADGSRVDFQLQIDLRKSGGTL